MVTGRYLQVHLLTGRGHPPSPAFRRSSSHPHRWKSQGMVMAGGRLPQRGVFTGGGGRPPHRAWSQVVNLLLATGGGGRPPRLLTPTHFPSTRIFALEPVRQLGFSDENPKRDPQVMLGVFENFPSVFSWGFATSPVLKNSPCHGTGRRGCFGCGGATCVSSPFSSSPSGLLVVAVDSGRPLGERKGRWFW